MKSNITLCYCINGYQSCEKVFDGIFTFSSLFSIKIEKIKIPAKLYLHFVIHITIYNDIKRYNEIF